MSFSKTMLLFLALLNITELYAQKSNTAPKLILQITVDQLRADLPRRYMSKMQEGGFKYLYMNIKSHQVQTTIY